MVRIFTDVSIQSRSPHFGEEPSGPGLATKLGVRQLGPGRASDYETWKQGFVHNKLFSLKGIGETFGISLAMQLMMRKVMKAGLTTPFPLAAVMALASSTALTSYQVLRYGLPTDQMAGQFANSFVNSFLGIFLGVKLGFSHTLAKEFLFEETAQAILATGIGYLLEGAGLRAQSNMTLGQRLKMEYVEGVYAAGISRGSRPVALKIEEGAGHFYKSFSPVFGQIPALVGADFVYDRVDRTGASKNSQVADLYPPENIKGIDTALAIQTRAKAWGSDIRLTDIDCRGLVRLVQDQGSTALKESALTKLEKIVRSDNDPRAQSIEEELGLPDLSYAVKGVSYPEKRVFLSMRRHHLKTGQQYRSLGGSVCLTTLANSVPCHKIRKSQIQPVRTVIYLRLLAQGWTPGTQPTPAMLQKALYDDGTKWTINGEKAPALPVATRSVDTEYSLFRDGHHRVFALGSLMLIGKMPPDTAFPVHIMPVDIRKIMGEVDDLPSNTWSQVLGGMMIGGQVSDVALSGMGLRDLSKEVGVVPGQQPKLEKLVAQVTDIRSRSLLDAVLLRNETGGDPALQKIRRRLLVEISEQDLSVDTLIAAAKSYL